MCLAQTTNTQTSELSGAFDVAARRHTSNGALRRANKTRTRLMQTANAAPTRKQPAQEQTRAQLSIERRVRSESQTRPTRKSQLQIIAVTCDARDRGGLRPRQVGAGRPGVAGHRSRRHLRRSWGAG